ncbi:Dinucleotide-utilizing enzymes involved in molybdopterin and thiamine biosynthesis family 2 [Mycolicibacterium hippocampi]|uniref:Dinucleotide-utilizing enzymes involved in molybdopterin and thiamine biosynthesis family 2 n=1 Tax=Mycolicibacterium hippocampi TaxID=659824 RepID=A0A850PUY4_9MYCO|nr:nitroreductase family protein [Mycolicibacterium hippocampi]NVN52263.1 Dinucleotide-utilizing enzymes involved in molybdopterin and thiamine biosynthesis family 2 [Mycolicibacterium hippocampi]
MTPEGGGGVNAEFPDSETIGAALSLAVRAPSVHNSQPWQWRLGDGSVHLYANPELLLPHTDPDGRDLMLSCGATLNHCVVALAALGWQSKVHRFPNPAAPNHLAVLELHRYPAADVDVALAAAIPRRRTDRRHYSSWPVPRGDIALMGARAARGGVTLRRVDDLAGLQRVVTEAARRHAADKQYLSELATWSGRYASTAGVPARSVPGVDGSGPIPVRAFAGGVLLQPPNTEPADDHAVVLALGTVGDDPMSRLRAGEVTSTVLLTATALGLASCPITEPLEIADTREAVRREVFGADGYPQMLLRIGWAPINADPLPSTPRRDLSEVVARLDDWSPT